VPSQVVALKRGLYSLKHLTASLGKVKLRVAAHLPTLLPQPEVGWQAIRKKGQSLGACDASGELYPSDCLYTPLPRLAGCQG